ncbi:MAG: ribosome maturation factor RimP [bacterium]
MGLVAHFYLMHLSDLQKIESLTEPVALSLGCELVACEWAVESGRRILRVLVDKPGGVSIGDCEKLSHLLGPLFEVEEAVPESYNLEVSSPGLERPLRKLADFERFSGNLIRLKTKIPIENRSRFKGTLEGVEGEEVLVKVDGVLFRIPHQEIEKSRLEIDWNQVFKKKKNEKK